MMIGATCVGSSLAQEHPPLANPPKDALACTTARHEAVSTTGKFQSQWPGDGRKDSFEGARVKA